MSPRVVSQARPGASSERPEETSSLASVEMESGTSERSSRDDRAYEELLEVVTRAVDRLKLDWPQEHETPKRSKLGDRFSAISMMSWYGRGVSHIRPVSLCRRRRFIRLSSMQRHGAI